MKLRAIVILISLAILGCEATPQKPSAVTFFPDKDIAADETKQVEVDGGIRWAPSDVTLRKGDLVDIEARGTWSHYGERNVSAEGAPGIWFWWTPLLPGAPYGALIGRIGDSKPFLIGSSRTFEVNEGGPLLLSYNDSDGPVGFRDNRGKLQVTIAVQRASLRASSPTPPTTSLEPRLPASTAAQRWAVVIGISDYKYSGGLITDLRHADRDAKDFAAWLLDPKGGGFERDHVSTLTNAQAIYSEVEYALKDFLKKTVKEDVVVIFFSGHGLADPEKPDNLYLCCYDTRPDRMASTAISMSLLDAAIKENIGAERVLIFADACHAGELGTKGVRVGKSINDTLTDTKLFAGQPGKLVFTSSEALEVSRESDKWDGGHGVFTWALLHGLRGEADGFAGSPKDGTVQLGELLDFVDQTVRRETGNTQHPQRVGRFDRNMAIGVLIR